MSDDVYRYVLSHLRILSDDQLKKLNFNKGLSFMEKALNDEEASKIKTLLLTIWQESSLSHHGVLGQKWGVRRYQNKDGTLTSMGKSRLGHDLFKKSSNFEIVTRNGEMVKAKPMPPPSIGKKLLDFLLEDIICDESLLFQAPAERCMNDTCPWRKK